MSDTLHKEFEEYLKENKTLAYLMLKKAEEYQGITALKFMKGGEWTSITWDIFGENVRAIARALLEMEIKPGDRAAIFSQNRPEWAIADMGILATRGVSVPVYATNSLDETAYIIEDAEVKIIFTGDQEQYDKAREILNNSHHLKTIVAFDKSTKIAGEGSYYLEDLLESGRQSDKNDELEKRLHTVDSDDILTLIYTSGTTGKPKGAIHTHKSFMAGIFPSSKQFDDIRIDDTSLAILPLSHVFERMWSYGCMTMGITIAYCPDPKQFVEVMAAIRPEYLTSVPRIWEKVYGTINDGLREAPPLKQKLFEWAKNIALEVFRKKEAGESKGTFLSIQHTIADKLIMSKVRDKLGCNNNKIFHVGGAAFSSEINRFFKSFGINIIQGYGLTEFFPVCVGFGDHGKTGACGPMIPMVDVRISEEGEIQLKGLNVMKGYYKKEEATAEAFTDDGWFRTGDIGVVEGDTYKYITITDRIKDLIITAGGKNVAPQQIELLFGDEMSIEQLVVVGEGRKFISALVVPAFEYLEDFARKNEISFSSHDDLIKNPDVITYYEDIVAKRTVSLSNYEKIKKITLLPKELSQEGGELTPTMKIKRKVIEKKYKELIEKMYT